MLKKSYDYDHVDLSCFILLNDKKHTRLFISFFILNDTIQKCTIKKKLFGYSQIKTKKESIHLLIIIAQKVNLLFYF